MKPCYLPDVVTNFAPVGVSREVDDALTRFAYAQFAKGPVNTVEWRDMYSHPGD